MKKITVFAIIYLCLAAAVATGQDAMEFYNRGLKSSLSYKKIEYFTKALQIDPNLAEAYEQRAVHYYFQERFDRAIEDYSRVIELKPYHADAYRMRGMAYLKKAHGEGMMAEIKRLVHRYRQPGVPENRNALVKAIDNFSRAIKMDPQMANAYSYRAEAYRLYGNTDQAFLDVTRALELQGDHKSTAHAYNVLALTYRQLGQNELYEAAYSKLVELDPYSQDYPPLNVPLILTGYTPNADSLKTVGLFGLIGIIVISFVLIFKLGLRAPKKKD